MTREEAMETLKKAVTRRKAAEEELEAARSDIDAGILELLRDGMKPGDIAPLAGVSYEKVRTIARANDIKQLRAPTVTSRKRKKRPES